MSVPTKVGKTGLALVKSFEGFFPRPYLDTLAKPPIWTQGFGSTNGIKPNGSPWSLAYGTARLEKEINERYAPPVDRLLRQLGRRVSQEQFDALVSAVYNLGPGVLEKGRSLGNALRAKDWVVAVPKALNEYVYAGGVRYAGLVRRRKAEGKLWVDGQHAGRDALTKREREVTDDMLRRRRTMRRHGGKWANVPYHHARAVEDRRWLEARLRTIATGSKARRPQRRDYIRRVLAASVW